MLVVVGTVLRVVSAVGEVGEVEQAPRASVAIAPMEATRFLLFIGCSIHDSESRRRSS